MNPLELAKSWPELAKANAAAILALPAWRKQVFYSGEDAVLTRAAGSVNDFIWLDVAFDDQPQTLGIGDSSSFGELHLVWNKRACLPPEIQLALVEKGCGDLFLMLENLVRKQFVVKGIAAAVPNDLLAFSVSGSANVPFALGRTSALELALGRIEALDLTHESIRSLSRAACVRYAEINLSAEERETLSAGDFLVLPPDFRQQAAWVLDPAAGTGDAQVFAAEAGSLTFAQLADDDLPPIPEPDRVRICAHGLPFAEGALASVGDLPAIRLTKCDS